MFFEKFQTKKSNDYFIYIYIYMKVLTVLGGCSMSVEVENHSEDALGLWQGDREKPKVLREI